MTSKQAAKEWIAKGGLNIYSEKVRVAAMRLLDDCRADEAWRSGLTVNAYEDAVHIFSLVTAWRVWDSKTQRERDAWKVKFDQTVEKLLKLMEESPAPSSESENAADLVLAIQCYNAKIDFEIVDQQLLSKPNDSKAPRAQFIQEFTRYNECGANVVASIAMTLFEDEAIDDRLVRRFAYRADSSKI